MALPKALESIINNPLVKSALFKQLTKVMKDNSIDLVTLSLDKDGKLQINGYIEEQHIMPKKDYVTMLNKVFNEKTD
jgi:hypothetical protein